MRLIFCHKEQLKLLLMKTFIGILTSILILSGNSWATVRTVSNDPAGGAQHATLQAAYTAAAAGDTLLLEGTGLNYSLSEFWAKNLVVVGIGFNPQKQNPRRSQIQYAWNAGGVAMFGINTNAGGSKFYGIEFTGNYGGNTTIQLYSTTNNILFEDCKFNFMVNFANISANNWVFRNCIFDFNNGFNVNVNGTTALISNVLFSNCVFDGYIEGSSNLNVNLTFDHCLFLNTTTTTFSNLQFATISNSIFMNGFPCCGATNSVFNNNLSRIAGTFPPSGTGNSGTGNISGSDPTFTSYSVGTLYATTNNYQLLPGSPAIGMGTGGSDIGVHGGGSGFSRFGEVLHTPIVRAVNIQNTSVAPNGTLNVNVNITKPNDN